LNALYETRFPRLKYVTFVAGRSKAQVAADLEAFLMPQPAEGEKDSEGAGPPPTTTHSEGSPEWTRELERGLADVFKIAKARLRALNIA
jgi:2-oxo-4-hydroxy-4-carboxy--5-ureidoimidazoline (OHCU) decarboxylase